MYMQKEMKSEEIFRKQDNNPIPFKDIKIRNIFETKARI